MKKLVLGLLVLPLLLVFSFFLGQKVTVSATEHADVITRMHFTDSKGNALTPPDIGQWESFRINADFYLHNNEVKAGDTTVVQLPDVITFPSDDRFDLTDNDGNIVAKAVVDRQTKKVTITYEPYVETHSDVKGTFFFYVRIDHKVVTTKKEVPIDLTVSNKLIPAGKVNFQGIREPVKADVYKVGWADDADPTTGHYSIAVNRSGKAMSGITITDVLESSQVTYKQETLRVHKGEWVFRDGDWALDNAVNITDQTTVTFNGNSFTVQLPDLAAEEGIKISYDVQLPYAPVDGDRFFNSVTLKAANDINVTNQTSYVFYQGSGKAEGHVFKVQIKKVSEDGSVLKGAKFDIIRDRSGMTVAQVETDENGIAEVDNLLKDTYTLKETQAPDGYSLADDVKVTPADFDADSKIALKTIVNKKQVREEPTPTTAVISVTKKLIGRDLKDGEFEFALTNAAGKVIETVTNKADGTVAFSALSFNKAGTYTYTVREVKGTAQDITYDEKTVTATVTVENGNNGDLVATVHYENDNRTFENSYVPPTVPNETTELTAPPSAGKKRVLPRTGSQSSVLLILSGLVLGGLGFSLKKKQKVN